MTCQLESNVPVRHVYHTGCSAVVNSRQARAVGAESDVSCPYPRPGELGDLTGTPIPQVDPAVLGRRSQPFTSWVEVDDREFAGQRQRIVGRDSARGQ